MSISILGYAANCNPPSVATASRGWYRRGANRGRIIMRQMLLIPALLAVTTPALADGAPMIHPSRDVAVEYRSGAMAQGPAGAAVTMRFSSKSGRIRIDGASGRGYAILDPGAGEMTMVMEERRMYVERQADPGMIAMFKATNAAFKKTGSDTIAGVACTIYDATFNDHSGQVCLTGDGVMLRARSADADRQRELEAVTVNYAEQPANLFEVPAGYQKLEMPNMPPGMNVGPHGGGPGGQPAR
jgi:hypothetical protein